MLPRILTQAAKISKYLRARGHFTLTLASGMLPETPKIIDLRPTQRHGAMNRKHTICYTLATLWECQRHQNIVIWVSKINTFDIPPNLAPSCRTQTPGILTHATIPSNLAPSGLVPGTLDPGTGYQNIKIPSRARPKP